MVPRKINKKQSKIRNATKLKRSRKRNEKKMAATLAAQRAEAAMDVAEATAPAEKVEVPRVIAEYQRVIARKAKRTNPSANTTISAKKARLLLKKGSANKAAKATASDSVMEL